MHRVEKIKLMIKSFKPENLEMQFRSIEQPLLQRFDNAKEGLFQNIIQKLRDTRQYIENCETVLENASPQTIFNRGYSMVRNKNSGEIVRSTENIQEGTELEIVPASGKITATVTSISSIFSAIFANS